MKKLFGTKEFYKMALVIALPLMVQNGLTSCVNLLDNLMVGSLGTESMTGVSIANQLLFVFQLTVFGGVSSAGIFTSQFYGKGDDDGIRYTMRFKFLITIVLACVAAILFSTRGSQLIELFLHEDEVSDIALCRQESLSYLKIMLWTVFPFILTQIYGDTLRGCGHTVVPMAASVAAILVNVTFNYILIFGKFGAPALGVRGAAIATLMARTAECIILVFWAHTHATRYSFIQGVWRSLYIPMTLVKRIALKGLPLLFNETFWSLGMTVMAQCYSTRGLSAVAAYQICQTVWQLFTIIAFALGNSVGIIVGQKLGAGEIEKAKDHAVKLITFATLVAAVCGIIMAVCSPIFPKLYNTTEDVRHLATQMLMIMSCCLPLVSFTHSCYFTLRCGGKTMITMLFDSVFVWAVCIPLAWCLSRFTGLPMLQLYAMCQLPELVKCLLGFFMVRSGTWAQDLTKVIAS
ncbi:MAG: MATE family efflux transporter [Oscillospiraceae bacterium]|nr:MATE family efflux transporter [Oscillospiraceae bacterium]